MIQRALKLSICLLEIRMWKRFFKEVNHLFFGLFKFIDTISTVRWLYFFLNDILLMKGPKLWNLFNQSELLDLAIR